MDDISNDNMGMLGCDSIMDDRTKNKSNMSKVGRFSWELMFGVDMQVVANNVGLFIIVCSSIWLYAMLTLWNLITFLLLKTITWHLSKW